MKIKLWYLKNIYDFQLTPFLFKNPRFIVQKRPFIIHPFVQNQKSLILVIKYYYAPIYVL